MDTIPQALTTTTVGPISIADLAQLIEAPVEKLRLLFEHKYLRVVFAKPEFERTIVARPGQRATDWLRTMFQPVRMRPLIPLREVGKLWKVTENHILRVCRVIATWQAEDVNLGIHRADIDYPVHPRGRGIHEMQSFRAKRSTCLRLVQNRES